MRTFLICIEVSLETASLPVNQGDQGPTALVTVTTRFDLRSCTYLRIELTPREGLSEEVAAFD